MAVSVMVGVPAAGVALADRVPVRLPRKPVGPKVTAMVHCVLGASVVVPGTHPPVLVEFEKPPPATTKPMGPEAVCPVLLRRKLRTAVWPWTTGPKSAVVTGMSVRFAGERPVPDSVLVGFPPGVALMVSTLLRDPAAEGVKASSS